MDAVTELVVQPPHQAEDVASLGDVDAGDEDAVVVGQLDFQRRMDGVHRAEHRRVRCRRRRLGKVGAWACDVVAQGGGIRLGELPGRLDGRVELLRHGRFQRGDL